jgi:transposase
MSRWVEQRRWDLIFVGVDWAEKHHDICVMDEAGTSLQSFRIAEGIKGIERLHATVAKHCQEPSEVVVGIETDRGLLVGALTAAGYEVFAINPMSVDRYRDRHSTSGAKSDPGDAKVLADLLRTDRHNHRLVAGDTELAQEIKVLARAHQSFIWDRQRQINRLRSALREFYPQALEVFGTDLSSVEALAVLSIAPTPELGKKLSLSKIASALRRGGRSRQIEATAQTIKQTLGSPQPQAGAGLSAAFGTVASSLVGLIASLNDRIAALESELEEHFESHPDAEILRSLPGLGAVLGARVLGEFGDDRTRFVDAKSRRNYAGTSPITKASGTRRVVLARFARNEHLFDACYRWAFCSLTQSPGARVHYDRHRAKGKTHSQALRSLANRLVGILDGCLRHRQLYSEVVAWGKNLDLAA